MPSSKWGSVLKRFLTGAGAVTQNSARGWAAEVTGIAAWLPPGSNREPLAPQSDALPLSCAPGAGAAGEGVWREEMAQGQRAGSGTGRSPVLTPARAPPEATEPRRAP